jgi:hypothetical protein
MDCNQGLNLNFKKKTKNKKTLFSFYFFSIQTIIAFLELAESALKHPVLEK